MKHESPLQNFFNSYGVELPEDVINQMGLEEGDILQWSRNDDGSYLVTVKPPRRKAMRVIHQVMNDYSKTFRRLADS